ncbi:MAG: PD-(D/E)XK nuclease family protein [Eubacteriales bacterium]
MYGRTGSGKSTLMLCNAAKKRGKHIFVLVPDREAVIAETRFAEAENAGEIDVVTFRRLCNFVFRKYGGICENYISRGAKKVMMYNTLTALSGMFSVLGGIPGNDISAAERFTDMRTEISRSAVAPSMLSRAAEKCGGEIGKKFSDMALLFSAFDAEVSSRFSDPDGMISKMNEILAEHDFFRGSDVYIDSFLSFSKDQLMTLRNIMRTADEVYISLPYVPTEDASVPCFWGCADTDRRLRALAKDSGSSVAEDTVLLDGRRYKNEELSFLSRNLFPGKSNVMPIYKKSPEHIKVISAANVFSESEAVCLDISKRVRGGARYRDFAVIVRNTADYTGVLDAEMKKYGIPHFISSRTDITERAFIKFIMSALSVCERGFSRELFISYIKTDFAGISPDEINIFENYVRKWSINGPRFYDGYEWNMDPEGYRGEMSSASAEKLIRISDIRERAVKPLKGFCDKICGKHTVRYFCGELYGFAISMGAPEKIKNDAARAANDGDKALYSELSQLFSVFCDALDSLVSASGDTEVGVSEFIILLRLVLSETDIGKIPTSLDEVTIFDASSGGIPNVRFSYLLGVCDGVFPAGVEDNGIFSDKEKELLSSVGIELTSTVERRLCDELYYFHRAACSPSEELIITYPLYDGAGKKTRISSALAAIKALFPELSEKSFESYPKTELIERPSASFEHISEGGALSTALLEYYSSKEEYADRIRYMDIPLSSSYCRIPENEAAKLFSKNMKTSYSRLEKYIACGFSYFCEYELELHDSAPIKFGSLDIGTLIHKILELTVKYAVEADELSDEDIKEKIRNVCREYTERLCRESYADISPRLLHLTEYLSLASEKFVFRMRDEFRESGFSPKDYELTIGKGEDIEPLVLENENGSITLRGKIDRVDAYEDGEGKIYIRVADYKTGTKKFELKNIEAGRDLQMLLYLFSVCENGKKRYGENILPAGVIYVSVRPSPKEENLGVVREEIEKCEGSGVFINDENVLRAMEPSLSGKYIPVTLGKSGIKSKNLIAAEEFSALKEKVISAVMSASDSLRCGIADARPTDEGACDYCKMHPVCRIKNVSKKGRQ